VPNKITAKNGKAPPTLKNTAKNSTDACLPTTLAADD
jgi:hypothetical protein